MNTANKILKETGLRAKDAAQKIAAVFWQQHSEAVRAVMKKAERYCTASLPTVYRREPQLIIRPHTTYDWCVAKKKMFFAVRAQIGIIV